MMPKKVSGIEGSDRDDANEVTDVANEEVGNDEEVNSEENENKDDGEEVDNEDKDDDEEVGKESAVPPSILIILHETRCMFHW